MPIVLDGRLGCCLYILVLNFVSMNAHTVRGRWKQVVEALVRVFIVSVALPVGLLPWVRLGACP
jgi:hypothetical protein